MNLLNEEDQLTIALAESYLRSYPRPTERAHQFSTKDNHLNPTILLQAALDYAPTVHGRLNIAKAIVNTDSDTKKSFNTRMEELSKQIFYNLLVPCTRSSDKSVVDVFSESKRWRNSGGKLATI